MSETIGLDIGSQSVKLVGLSLTSKGPFLTHIGIKEIPYGEQREDRAFISETIKALYREIGLKPGRVRLVVSGSDVHVRRLTLPSMPKAELKEAVRWEMKNHLPYPIESAQMDYHILEAFVDQDLKKMDLITVTCPNDHIDRALSIAEGAGLKAVHIAASPIALWDALTTLGHIGKEEVVAFIDLGEKKTGIYFFRNGILQFSREVTPGGADLTHAIMEGMESEEAPDILYEQSERIKKTMGIPSEAFDEKNGDQSIHLSKISFLVRPVLERLIAEINRSFDYFRNQFSIERIDRLLLGGGGANLKNITTYLAGELRLPAEQFNPFRKIRFDAKRSDAPFLDQMGPLFAVASGAALPKITRIELLPSKKPTFSKAQMEKYIPRISLLMTLLVFLWIVWDMRGEISHIQKERDEKTATVRTLETFQAKLTMLKEKEAQIKKDLSIFPPSIITPVPFREVLGGVSHIVPENATFTLLSIHSKSKTQKRGPQADEGNELQIKGLAFGSDLHCLTALARIIEGLERFPLLRNAKLISADENRLYNHPGIGFEIVCDIDLNSRKGEKKE